MKTINSIPTSNTTCHQISWYWPSCVNTLNILVTKSLIEEEAKEKNQNNAEDIYNSLKQPKGSAFKVVQMLSMDKSIMPSLCRKIFFISVLSPPYRHLLLMNIS